LQGIELRLTYRTMRVLIAVADHPGASNREVAEHSGTKDEGQISRLLSRLQGHSLIENTGEGKPRGGSNAWHLTERGEAVRRLIGHWQGQ
jgi:DNA-binding IclR family transcriptional regulator